MFVIQINESNFRQEVLESDLLVLVDFWAPWCAPCRVVSPILEDLAEEYKEKVKICKVNVDEAGQLASQYGIMSIPTLMFFKNGKVMQQIVGALSRSELKARIEDNL